MELVFLAASCVAVFSPGGHVPDVRSLVRKNRALLSTKNPAFQTLIYFISELPNKLRVYKALDSKQRMLCNQANLIARLHDN